MTIVKRLFSLRVIGLLALLLFIVGSYYATRKVLALGIELGMDRKTVIEVLGKPSCAMRSDDIASFKFAVWNKMLFSKDIYWQQIFLAIDRHGKVEYFQNTHVVFGHEFVLQSVGGY